MLQYFEWFSWNSGQNSQNFGEIRGFPVMLTKHFLQDFQCRPWGGVDIFWNSPIEGQNLDVMLNKIIWSACLW